jgi:hypothetical protein
MGEIVNSKPSSRRPPRDLRAARVVAVLIAVVFVGLGLYSITAEHYYGYNSRRNIEVVLDGPRAVSMGYVYIALGLLPLAFCCPTGRAAAWWGAICSVAFAIALGVSLYG